MYASVESVVLKRCLNVAIFDKVMWEVDSKFVDPQPTLEPTDDGTHGTLSTVH